MQGQDYRLIPLRGRDGSVRAHAQVDPSDYKRFGHLRWHLLKRPGQPPYVARNVRRNGVQTTAYLHREILGLAPGDGREGDHIDRNPLNNQRNNLRSVPKGTNHQNRGARAGTASGLRGVSWSTQAGRWQAFGALGGRVKHLGFYSESLDAARAAEAYRRIHMPMAVPDSALDPVPPCPCRTCQPHRLHPNARFSTEEVLAMRQLYAAGESQSAIARRFGVTRSTVAPIVRGDVYRHLVP